MIPEALQPRPMSPIPTGRIKEGTLAGPVGAVLFDIYGTLFISGAGDISSAEAPAGTDDELAPLTARFHIPCPPSVLRTKLQDAIAASHAADRRRGIPHPEVDILAIWRSVVGPRSRREIRDIALGYEMAVNPVFPMPGLRRLLDCCRTAGLAMGIVSNAQFYTPRLFEWFLGDTTAGLGFHPDLTIFSYALGRAKPDEALFHMAAERLSSFAISVDNTVYMGNDMRNDIRPAQARGFQTVLFAGDRRSLRLRKNDPAVSGCRPDAVITDLEQLWELISAANS